MWERQVNGICRVTMATGNSFWIKEGSFLALYRVLHNTRVPQAKKGGGNCLCAKYVRQQQTPKVNKEKGKENPAFFQSKIRGKTNEWISIRQKFIVCMNIPLPSTLTPWCNGKSRKARTDYNVGRVAVVEQGTEKCNHPPVPTSRNIHPFAEQNKIPITHFLKVYWYKECTEHQNSKVSLLSLSTVQ